MSLEHPQEQSASPAAAPRLSQAELSQLLDAAIARHSAAQAEAADQATLEDAVEIARTLGIPDEHVHAAARELLERRARDAEARQAARYRRERRLRIREQRKASFLRWLGPMAALALLIVVPGFLVFGMFPVLVVAGVLCGVPLLAKAWQWLAAPVSDSDAGAPLPVAGTCRVCGRPAVNERSTFCEEHRWKGPS